jgi:DNA-binding NtrC family response regulator/CHASE2 domain-containing sensor protein
VSPRLLVLARDAASEGRFGAAAWDRAVVARVITGLSRSGAAAIAVDLPLGAGSAPGRGGASSDALLSQATSAADNVVYPFTLVLGESRADPAFQPHASWPSNSQIRLAPPVARGPRGPLPGLAQHAKGVGHTLAPADSDGVVRRVPLFLRVHGRAVPTLGLAVAAVSTKAGVDQAFHSRRIPVDSRGQALIGYTAPERLTVIPFLEIWSAIEEQKLERLRPLVEDKIVLVLVEPARELRRTPVGPLSEVAIQTQALNSLLTGSWRREVPLAWTALAALVLSGLVAWAWLTLPWWMALAGVGVLAGAAAGALRLAPPLTGVVPPVVLPLAAVMFASAGALLWSHFGSALRLRHLEGELEGMRHALVRHESVVEALEEDLEAARVAVARSTGAERELLQTADALRAQLAEAQQQEEHTRSRLGELERELRAADTGQAPLDNAEQERLRRQCEALGIITRDAAVLGLFRDLAKAARSSLPILVAGEPGTGKELFARAAHRLSARPGGPFVAVNMAAISPELFESELFGHVKGSFTGAIGDRRGYFEQADRGTIFLDEIGDLRAEHQSKLLRVLQERSFHRVGATRPTAVDVRIVAASNRDLERGIAEGWFREDLYFRLKGLVLRLPPLRERRADIAPLAGRFLEEAVAEAGHRVSLSETALQALERHDWPGNIRELQHCLRQAVALADGAVLSPESLRLTPPTDTPGDTAGDGAVLACLRRYRFDMQATARALGWDRSTVTQRLKGLGFRALVEAGGDQEKAALALAGDPALSRTMELKLGEYHGHLVRAVAGFESVDAALTACRRRFKNLPERHFRSLEVLVRQHFAQRRA